MIVEIMLFARNLTSPLVGFLLVLHDGLSFFGRLFSPSSSGWFRRQASLSSSPRRSLCALRSSSASRSRRSRSRRSRSLMPQILLLFHAALSRARSSIRASSCAVPESTNWPPFYPPNHESPLRDALPLRAGRLSTLLFHAMFGDPAEFGSIASVSEVSTRR